jgi:nucleoside-diphosphate-sugar epimerase
MTTSTYERVLVTGATGFIGAHVADEVLRRGIPIKIASRSKAKAEQFIEARKDKANLISYAVIDDFEQTAGGLDKAAEGCDGVIHVASPFNYEVDDVKRELIEPAIAGAKAMMKACSAAGTIKRVVLTSSFASVIDVNRKEDHIFTYTGADWNPLTYEDACKSEPVTAYRGSKKYAELEAWNYVKDNQTKFDLVTLCPPMTFGPIVHPVENVAKLNVSNGVLWSIAEGVNPLPVSRVPVWIDVRDLAKAHVESLLRPEVGGKRYIAASTEFFSYQAAADIMRETFTWAKDKVTEGEPGASIEYQYKLDGQTMASDLGIKYTPFKDTVVDSISQFSKMPGSFVN